MYYLCVSGSMKYAFNCKHTCQGTLVERTTFRNQFFPSLWVLELELMLYACSWTSKAKKDIRLMQSHLSLSYYDILFLLCLFQEIFFIFFGTSFIILDHTSAFECDQKAVLF